MARQALSPEVAIDFALAQGTPAVNPVPSTSATPVDVRPPAEPIAADQSTRLSRRELEVAALIAQGLTNRQIAERLISASGRLIAMSGTL
jgi:DNA-binding NarL/FixJ family response regulator